MKFITRNWYKTENKPAILLTGLSKFYRYIVNKRRLHFSQNQHNLYRPPIPVIVIGNITVGGTGKTPLVIAITHYLLNKGYKVGIISRGYKGKSQHWPIEVNPVSSAKTVGDEPLLIVQSTNVPVFVGPKRNDDIMALLKQYPDTNVILSDDGLQHYKMIRDIEIVVIDAERGFGNKKMLPAGPLREPLSRLNHVDMKVFNGLKSAVSDEHRTTHDFTMQLKLGRVYQLINPSNSELLTNFKETEIHAVAGIGNPERFFVALRSYGLKVIEHAFPDHYQYSKEDIDFDLKVPVFMTEKDAVKCKQFDLQNCWVVKAEAQLDEIFYHSLVTKLKKVERTNGQKIT